MTPWMIWDIEREREKREREKRENEVGRGLHLPLPLPPPGWEPVRREQPDAKTWMGRRAGVGGDAGQARARILK